MTGKLTGKRALVTGAASGIGKSIAESYAREGAVVAVQARSIERSAETLESITAEGGEAFAVAADLTDTGEIEAMCQQAIERLGGIDIVMNNAGVGEYKKVVDMEESFWDRIMDVNLKAPFLVSKYTLPAMIEQGAGGVQLFNASTNAKTADADWTAYNATKHVGFVRCLAAEVGPQGIRVNAICPGWIDTKMAVELHEDFAREMKEPYEKVYDESMRLNMLSEIIPPQAVADMAVFLAGEGGTYVTGQAINVCAGLSVH